MGSPPEVRMKRLFTLFLLFTALFISGCAMFSSPLEPGATDEDVFSRHGKPNAIYQDGDTTLWEYNGGFWSQYTHMARLDKNNVLLSWEQVRTDQRFATLTLGKSVRSDVLKTVGHPTEVSSVRVNNFEVWTYRYKQDGVWDSLMHLMFDEQGVLQRMEAGQDLRYEERGFFGRSGVNIGVGGGRGGSWGGIGIGIGF